MAAAAATVLIVTVSAADCVRGGWGLGVRDWIEGETSLGLGKVRAKGHRNLVSHLEPCLVACPREEPSSDALCPQG